MFLLLTDTISSHTANITVQILNTNDEVIVEDSVLVDIPPGGVKTVVFIFRKTNIVEEYVSLFAIIREIS